ncbi:MAG: poly-gamma-glutamate biosynthesis protein PgsC [Rectinema sp.]
MIQDIAIGLGIVVNLVATEIFGLASGGFVVPGYLALFLNRPLRILATYSLAILTWVFVRFVLSRIMVLYGRRRFAVTLLVGFVVGFAAERISGAVPGLPGELRSIGYLIPGLLAAGMLSDGVLPTCAVSLGGAAIVRLLLAALGALRLL